MEVPEVAMVARTDIKMELAIRPEIKTDTLTHTVTKTVQVAERTNREESFWHRVMLRVQHQLPRQHQPWERHHGHPLRHQKQIVDLSERSRFSGWHAVNWHRRKA